jgi:excisionase family DNA binding protein
LTAVGNKNIMPKNCGVANMTQWLSVDDIAKELNVSIDTVRNWIKQKKLTAYRVGRDYRIKREDYDKFLLERKTRNDEE